MFGCQCLHCICRCMMWIIPGINLIIHTSIMSTGYQIGCSFSAVYAVLFLWLETFFYIRLLLKVENYVAMYNNEICNKQNYPEVKKHFY